MAFTHFRIVAAVAAFSVLFQSAPLRAENTFSGGNILRQVEAGFVEVYEKVAPAVVVIEATKKPEEVDSDDSKPFGLFNDDKASAMEGQRQYKMPRQPLRSEGSGFIIRAEGFILTNLHVIVDAEKINVRTKDGRNFPAKVIGSDDRTDIAVVKVEAKDLPYVEFGDSDALKVGQLVCAIGTPYNQDFSFTCGWVSGKGRSNLLAPSAPTVLYEDYIQTDAFINPGNSGGPLFDVEGKVMGMNTLINGLARGLAFAIPSNLLRDIGRQIMTTGKVSRPWLGIRIESLAENAMLREHALGVDQGVVVDTVEANAPAFRSDLRPADIISEVDGVAVSTPHDLLKEVMKKRVGQPVQLTVWRVGEMLKIPVTTGELPADAGKIASAPVKRPVMPEAVDEGFGMKLKDAKPGAQVVEVLPDSAAALAEIFPGDVVTDVETRAVTDAASCIQAIRAAGEKRGARGVLVNIDRKGRRIFTLIRAEH